MTPGRDQIVLQASEAFKEALAEHAQLNATSMAAVIREAVSAVIGYDLASEPANIRTTRYGTEKERKQAALARATVKRHVQKAISEAVMAGNYERASALAAGTIDPDAPDQTDEQLCEQLH